MWAGPSQESDPAWGGLASRPWRGRGCGDDPGNSARGRVRGAVGESPSTPGFVAFGFAPQGRRFTRRRGGGDRLRTSELKPAKPGSEGRRISATWARPRISEAGSDRRPVDPDPLAREVPVEVGRQGVGRRIAEVRVALDGLQDDRVQL